MSSITNFPNLVYYFQLYVIVQCVILYFVLLAELKKLAGQQPFNAYIAKTVSQSLLFMISIQLCLKSISQDFCQEKKIDAKNCHQKILLSEKRPYQQYNEMFIFQYFSIGKKYSIINTSSIIFALSVIVVKRYNDTKNGLN